MKENQTTKTHSKKTLVHKPVNLLRVHGNLKWHEACGEVYQLVKSEPGFNIKGEPVDFKPIPERRLAYESLVLKYIQYVKSFQVLCECYMWVVHPQKKSLLTRCIEGVAGRICEIKLEMIDLEKSLYNHFDDILFDMGLTPVDLKLQIPKYMIAQRYKILHMRERLLNLMLMRLKELENPEVDDIISKVHDSESSPDVPGSSQDVASGEKQDEEHAGSTHSTVISSHPVNVCQPREIVTDSRSFDDFLENMNNLSQNLEVLKAVEVLQSYWRCWLSRRAIERRREDEEVALGMKWPTSLTDVDMKDEADYENRRIMWRKREKELQISKAMEHERFMAAHGHNMAWELKYNITQWLLELRDLQGSFPDYPDEEEGGCERLFAMKTVEDVEDEIEEMLNPSPAKAAKEEKSDAGKKVEVDEPEGWKPGPTAALPKLMDALDEYNSYWYLKDEMDNVEQKFDRQLMLEQVRDESGKQIRLQVDELMRYELDKLRCGIEFIEMDEKPKAPKETPKEKEVVTKDPLASKTVEELYGELVLQGIVTPIKNVKMADIIGDFNFLDILQLEGVPTIADIKTVLTHLVVFPLSSQFLHSVLPITSRMLLAGSSGVGKTMTIHALCREIGTNLFNISPEVLAGKYEGQQNQEYLMNALLKVGKSMEPTIFWISNCEIMFTKAPPGAAAGQDRPQRWVSVFSKMMDKVKKGDRMFLIGETSDPFKCNSQAMFDFFKNVVYFPRPEYGSRVMLWKEFLAKMPICRSSNALSPSLLAQFSDGYSGKQIEEAICATLTSRRLMTFRPVTNRELLTTLQLDSVRFYDEDVAAWSTWYASTPLMKQRRLMIDEEDAARLEAV